MVISKSALYNVLIFFGVLIFLTLIGYVIIKEPLEVSDAMPILIIQSVYGTIILVLISLSYLNEQNFTLSALIGKMFNWALIVVPTMTIGLELAFSNGFEYLPSEIFWFTLIIWIVYTFYFAKSIRDRLK